MEDRKVMKKDYTKENRDKWVCDLVMVYDSYKIHAEYESRLAYSS